MNPATKSRTCFCRLVTAITPPLFPIVGEEKGKVKSVPQKSARMRILEKLSWLDYTGQTTSELIGCKKSHRIDSLLCAFEEGIQAKLDQAGAGSITGEEDLVLAVMALERE